MTVTLVTKFERLRAILDPDANVGDQGVTIQLASDTTQLPAGSIVFYPWHVVEYIIMSRPENHVSEDDIVPLSGAV